MSPVETPPASAQPHTGAAPLAAHSREHDDATRFVLEIGRALHSHGVPAHRLEQAMSQIAASLGLRGEFFAIPTSLIVTLHTAEGERTSLMRFDTTEVNLEKLALLDALAGDVAQKRVSPAEGLERMRAIVAAPRRYRRWISVAAYGLASGAGACFFGGGVHEIAVSSLVGAILGVLTLVLSLERERARIFELVAATLASLAGIWAAPMTGTSAALITLSALIVLLPGFTLTVAMNELTTGHLASGSSRFMAAIIVLLQLVLGVALGERLALVLLPPAPAVATMASLPAWVELVALVAMAFALTALFRAHPRDAGSILAACCLAFFGARAGAWLLGPELGVLPGALLLGMASNLYARLLHRPATIPLVPAVILLVPGSVGFRGLSSFLRNDTLAGIDTTFTMFIIAAAIVAGLIMANSCVPPRRAL